MSPRRPARNAFPPEAVRHLRRADPVLGGLIDRIGPIEQTMEPDLWWSLVDAIASQQISARAATTIIGRLEALGGGDGRRPTPREILDAPEEVLRATGLTRTRTVYLKDLAAKWLDGSLPHDRLASLPDEEVIAALTRVKGIGVWTAEIFLIFTLARPDVLPADDLGVQNAAQRLYGLPARPKPAELRRLGEPWRPWRSVASRYLWRSLYATPPIGASES